MVGVTGFEPAASCSQSRRATNCATPRFFAVDATANNTVLYYNGVLPFCQLIHNFLKHKFY